MFGMFVGQKKLCVETFDPFQSLNHDDKFYVLDCGWILVNLHSCICKFVKKNIKKFMVAAKKYQHSFDYNLAIKQFWMNQ